MNAPRASTSAPCRVLVIPNEFPLPANSGGRVDVWRRMRVMHDELGCELALLTWFDAPRDGAPSAQSQAEAGRVVTTIHLSAVQRSKGELVRRLVQMVRWPSHAAARWVTLNRPAALQWARDFQPDLILLDGLYGAPVAEWLSHQLKVPVVYRSHNIEHVYMRRQLRKTKLWTRRLGLAANLLHLEHLERSALINARYVLDISVDDMAQWTQEGMRNLHWLPPIVDASFAAALCADSGRSPSCDVLYFGNLNTPNNVDALRWLITSVLPRISHPDLRIIVAGSSPGMEAIALCGRDKRIRLIADPIDMAGVIRSARVIVNPVLAGSGVNIKSVEMLFTDASLVSTSVGVQGLPDGARRCFSVGDDAEEFAAHVAQGLSGKSPFDPVERRNARAHFLPGYAADILARAFCRDFR